MFDYIIIRKRDDSPIEVCLYEDLAAAQRGLRTGKVSVD